MLNRLVLALDNSLDFLNIALAREHVLLEERHIKPHQPPSQIIPREVLNILISHGYGVDDLSLIITTLGPGSFTGIRVGLAFCKGLASGKSIPLIGVPTLDVLVSSFSFLRGYFLCPLLDAKKGEVFAALYRVSHENIEQISDYQALKPAEVARMLKTPCLCFGSGVKMLSLIHISEPTRLLSISYAVFCLKKKNNKLIHKSGNKREKSKTQQLQQDYPRDSYKLYNNNN